MTKVVIDLRDDEFLQLGAMAFAVDAWTVNPVESSFGRLCLKLKSAIIKKSTPGQLQHFESLVTALKGVKIENSVDYMMVEDGMDGIVSSLFEQFNNETEE